MSCPVLLIYLQNKFIEKSEAKQCKTILKKCKIINLEKVQNSAKILIWKKCSNNFLEDN